MGVNFAALMKYPGPDEHILRALDLLEVGILGEIVTLNQTMRDYGFCMREDGESGWEYIHRRELLDPRLERRPNLPDLGVALFLPGDLNLTFGSDAVAVDSLRWYIFLTEPVIQRAMLGTCSYLAGLLRATDCILTGDNSPVVQAFWMGARFDACLASAGPEDGECPNLSDLYLEIPGDSILRIVDVPGGGQRTQHRAWDQDQPLPEGWERATSWDSKGYWRLPMGGVRSSSVASQSAVTQLPQPVQKTCTWLMDEPQWAKSPEPGPMLEWMLHTGEVSLRKLRLWACACVRRLLPLLEGDRSRRTAGCVHRAVEAVEQFVEGKAGGPEVEQARRAAEGLKRGNHRAAVAAARTTRLCAPSLSFPPSQVSEAVAEAVAEVARQPSAETAERKAQADLLRDIFGNPFRPMRVVPAVLAWRDRLAVRLAQAAYDQRLPDSGYLHSALLSILADALLDAGCDNEEIMRHLREPGPHVRGCFALDLILGRE